MSCCNCCFLTCIEVSQEAGKVVWYSHLCKNFSQFVVIHKTVVSEAEVDVFLEPPSLRYDPTNVGIWSLVPLPLWNPACTSGSSRLIHEGKQGVLLSPKSLRISRKLRVLWSFLVLQPLNYHFAFANSLTQINSPKELKNDFLKILRLGVNECLMPDKGLRVFTWPKSWDLKTSRKNGQRGVGILNPTGVKVNFKMLDRSEIWQYSKGTTPKSVVVYWKIRFYFILVCSPQIPTTFSVAKMETVPSKANI